jgi:Domain of unknown function (DUF3284).
MQLTLKCSVSAQDFYETLLQSVVMEVENSTSRKVNPYDLKKDYKYKAKVSDGKNTYESTVKIKSLKPSKEYISLVERNGVSFEIKYSIETINDKEIKVTLSQTRISNIKENWAIVIIGKFKMNHILRNIEMATKQRLKNIKSL